MKKTHKKKKIDGHKKMTTKPEFTMLDMGVAIA